MGNSQSNRKITVVNDEVAGVIKISDSVVRRLRGELEGGREEQQAPRPPPQQQVPVPSHVEAPPSPPPPRREIPSTAAPKAELDPSQFGRFLEEAHLTALKIRQEREAEIRRVEEHWRKHLAKLQNDYKTLADYTEAEFRAAIEDVQKQFARESCGPVCEREKADVLGCYAENSKESLKCSSEVKNFAACVQKTRLVELNKA